MSTIYGIRNEVTGRVYIGQTNCIDNRWRAHRGYLRRGTHSNSLLQWDWVFYGEDVFKFFVIEDYHRISDIELQKRENINIREFKQLNGVYNLDSRFGR